MTRTLRIVVLAIAIAVLSGGIVGKGCKAEASTAYAQLVVSQVDGCAYFWDGNDDTALFCPRTHGLIDIYQESYDQRVYVAQYVSEGFGEHSRVTVDDISVSHCAVGFEFYTFRNGTTGTKMTDAQLEVANILAAVPIELVR